MVSLDIKHSVYLLISLRGRREDKGKIRTLLVSKVRVQGQNKDIVGEEGERTRAK